MGGLSSRSGCSAVGGAAQEHWRVPCAWLADGFVNPDNTDRSSADDATEANGAGSTRDSNSACNEGIQG